MWKIFSGILSGKRYDIWKLRGTKVVPLKIVSQKDHLLTDKEILGN